MAQNTKRSYGIDLARSVAIVGVVLVHSKCFDNGRFGVQLFFLVSGYLLADLGNLSNRDFLIRRGLRLFPLYWAILILFYGAKYDSFWNLIVSLFLIQNIHWVFFSIPGAWSISNEWIFSLLLPMFSTIKRNRLILLIVLSWISQVLTSFLVYKWGGILTTDSPYQYAMKIWMNSLNPAINLAFLLIGVGIKNKMLPVLKSKYIALSIIVFGNFTTYVVGHELLFLWPLILWAIFSMCLNWIPKSKLVKTVVTYIGRRTYGIFFIHFIVLEYIISGNTLEFLPEIFGLRNIGVFILTFSTSAFLSEFAWRFIEKPSIRFSGRFIRR